jgi:intracellular sulfur oxidation DsrE/DsrF family protein
MPSTTPLERRSFLSRFAVGAAVFGSAFSAGALLPSTARAERAPRTGGHPEDAWLDDLKGMHKIIYDGVTTDNGFNGWFYARNFLIANALGYKMKDSDCSVVVSVRHLSTVYGFNDAMWAKYPLGEIVKLTDPATSKAPVKNLHVGDAKELADRGIQLAVCGLATSFFAGELAKKGGGTAADIEKEMKANLVVPQARIVPAGVVVVSRAQEHGFTYTYVG